MWTSSRPQPPQPQQTSSYRQQQQHHHQQQQQQQQHQQHTRYAAPPPPPPPQPSHPRYQQSTYPPQPPSPYYEEAEEEVAQQYAEQAGTRQLHDYGDSEYEQQHDDGDYGDYGHHEHELEHEHSLHQHGQQQQEDDHGPSQQELYDYDEQQQHYAEDDEQQDERGYDEQDDGHQHQQPQAGGHGDGREDGDGGYYELQHYAQPADDEQGVEADADYSQQSQGQPASPPPPGLPSAALHPVAESEHEPSSPPARPFAAAAALSVAASPSSPDSSSVALSPSSPPFSSSLPAAVTVSEEEQPVYDDVVDAVLVLLRRAEGGGSAAVDEGEEAQWLTDLRQEFAAFSSSPPADFLPFASSLLAADKLSLFARLLSAASESLQVSAACATLRVELEAELQRDTDLTLLSASLLEPATRPGLCCLRFTPAAIPPSFHEALTLSLLAELQQRQPELYRRGELRTAGKGGAEEGETVCVVVEASRLAVSRGAAALASELRRCSARVRLPEQAERQLSEHLKRGISQAESALKRGAGGGLGVSVIRSLPIVGSVFSFFAGSGSKKGHSYNISSSYDSGQSKAKGAGEGKTPAGAPAAAASNAPAKATASRAAPAQADVTGGATNQAAASAAAFSQQQEEEEGNGQVEAESAPLEPSDADALFEQLSARDPADLLRVMTEGSVVTCFFPSNPDDPSDLTASAVPLYLFFEPEIESLCWCEPGRRYVSAEQSLPISAISELHLGSSGPFFPADAEESRCFSIVSDLITLHGEEQDAESRDELMLALYSLLNQAQQQQQAANGADDQQHYDQQPQHQQPAQQQRQGQQSRRDERKANTGDVMPALPAAGGGAAGSPSALSSSRPAVPLAAAVSLLESGSDWTVFLINRADPSRTSRHPVVLWWSRDVDGRDAGKGRLCWARRSATAASGQSRLEYHPSRSLLLDGQLEVSLGKQSKAMLNAGMDDVDDGRCVSICVDRTVLNLAARSERDRDAWLAALHTVMIESGNKLVTQ